MERPMQRPKMFFVPASGPLLSIGSGDGIISAR
jgi:hypothetical protein